MTLVAIPSATGNTICHTHTTPVVAITSATWQ